MKEVHTTVRLDFKDAPKGKVTRYQFDIAADGLGYPIYIPVIVARGIEDGPLLGVTAVIHGNELNGLPVIQRVMREIDIQHLKGIVVAIPVINIPGFLIGQREFNDGIDLNKKMPGKERGNRSDIFAHRFFSRIVSQFDYLIDLHTASFGRINSFYTRADLENPIVAKMVELLHPEISLHNKGVVGTLRKAAMDQGIPTVTAELRDPYKYQKKIIKDATQGIQNILEHFQMQPVRKKGELPVGSIVCSDSYWIYTTQGGLLTVIPSLLTMVKKGELIAHIRNVFGDVIEEYTAPEDGIVIGKSISPVNQTGSRIIHLGVVDPHNTKF
jgi:uncharacterized protein